MSEWRVVFWTAFGVFNFTNLIYIIWASGEVQDFNTPIVANKEDFVEKSNAQIEGHVKFNEDTKKKTEDKDE